jgi:lipid-A-disaccharide synthase
MPMHIFISAGEPSGDLHGANLIRALRERVPDVTCTGFGGERMEAAGGRLLYPLCQLAIMWFARALANAPRFLELLSRADRYFRHQRPDAIVLIDFPGFNWWLARRAHFHGIPVFYFVPPQLWGWAGWRVGKMQRWVDHVLCALPFEEDWFRSRGVDACFVGHPYFDDLARQRPDAAFLGEQRSRPGEVVGLLPGSRNQEVQRNLSSLVRAATIVHQRRPQTRFLVACFKPAHRDAVERYVRGRGLPIECHVGRTPEIIARSHACMAVSGSVGLELLYHAKPSVVVYRIGRLDLKVARRFITSRYISLVNLLAGKELFPEFLTDHCEADAMADHVLRWLTDPASYAEARADLQTLRHRVAVPGACDRAATFILETLSPREIGRCA